MGDEEWGEREKEGGIEREGEDGRELEWGNKVEVTLIVFILST